MAMALFAAVTLTACGGGGGGGDDTSDKQPPSISSKTPDDKAVGVLTKLRVKIRYSENIKTVTTANYELKETISGTIVTLKAPEQHSGNEVEVEPVVDDLKVGTNYTMTSKNVSDLNGNISATESWTFTTADSSDDGSIPTIVDFTPVANASNVPIDINPQVTFNVNVDPASATAANVRMNNGAVAGTITVNEKVIIFNPAANLAAETDQELKVSGIKSLSGKTMSGEFSLKFKTGSSPGTLTTTTAIAIINGGDSRGTWNGTTGVANVLIPGNPWDFAVAWKNQNVTAGKSYQISFSCGSVPVNQSIQVELKKNTAPYTAYGKVTTTCNGGIITVIVPSDTTDSVARLGINLGKTPGTYTLGTVLFMGL